jgi:transposase
MVEDGAALSGEAGRSWAERQEQPTFLWERYCGSRAHLGRDLPAAFGHWNSVFTRFRDWAKSDVVWKRLFEAVSDDPDVEYAMVGRHHRQGATATVRAQKADSKPSDWPLERRHDHQILALTDALGNLVRFVLLPGQRFDTVGVRRASRDWPSTR